MVYIIAPDFVSFISGGNIFNSQIYKALLELGKPVKQIGYPLAPDTLFNKDDILIFDSIFINELDSSQMMSITGKKYFICHLLPSMLGTGRGKKYELKILDLFDKVIVNSRFCFEALRRMGVTAEVVLIQPLIERSIEVSTLDKDANALIIANWLPSKQIDKFLYCLANEKKIPIGISIIGSAGLDPIYFKKCHRIISESQELTSKVRILGELDRQSTLSSLAKSKLLLDCSAFETYGMAVAEAVANGVPVLTLGNGNTANLISADSICNSIEEMVNRLISQNWTVAKAIIKDKLITDWQAFLNQFQVSELSLF